MIEYVKLSAKTELTSVAAGDFVPIIDVSDMSGGASGTSKKITVQNLVTGVDTGSLVDTGSTQSITGEKTFTHLSILNGTTSTNGIAFGSDVNLYRAASNILRTDDGFVAAAGLDYDGAIRSFSTGTSGALKFSGASGGAYDVNLYASAADTLKTDDAMVIDGASLTLTSGFLSTSAGTLGPSTGVALTLTGDNPFYVKGASGATGTIFQVQNNGGAKFLTSYATGGQVLNEDGNDYDTRIEGDTDTNLFLADASTDKVGIGTNSPDQKLTVSAVAHVVSATGATAGGAAAVTIGSSTVLGIYFGSGVPTVSAPQGSLYLRTDGSSTSTRAYINTNGSTTWTAITTAA